ncbi:hypothetical protein [Stakelama saccharophila]|uniref:Uncharacterized protein n=1 Tax=Stakelama saccharophila TaxID=3075605 RepID=A0ABZ0B602_9SPHN|nr:hypothetical protein [Stakelama sp. W311]WNO52683.1 hypothetical protein RPR59_09420 [Stakelama sp. W311]
MTTTAARAGSEGGLDRLANFLRQRGGPAREGYVDQRDRALQRCRRVAFGVDPNERGGDAVGRDGDDDGLRPQDRMRGTGSQFAATGFEPRHRHRLPLDREADLLQF